MKKIKVKTTNKILLLVMIISLLFVSIYGTTVVKDKHGANTIIPVRSENIQLVDATVTYLVDEPPVIEEPTDNVDLYRGTARVKTEYVLKNTGEEAYEVVMAFAVNPMDEIKEIMVNNQIYTPEEIEVDRLTNYYEDGFDLSGEYKVTNTQIVDRIVKSMTDTTDNYITGDWQRLQLIKLTIEPGKTGRFSIDYMEQSGTSRRGDNAIEAVPWEPEFYYYFDFYKFFDYVSQITVNIRLPKGFEIEHTSYEEYKDVADYVYQISIEEMPKSNLIFTVHNPLNTPKDTGIVSTVSLAVTLMIGSGIILVLLAFIIVFIILILPKLKVKKDAKAAKKLKNILAKKEAETLEQEKTEEEKDSIDDVMSFEADDYEEDQEKYENAIVAVDEYMDEMADVQEDSLNQPIDEDETIKKITTKKTVKSIVGGIRKGFKKVFSSKKDSSLDAKSMETNLENALAADLDEMIHYESDNSKKVVFEPEVEAVEVVEKEEVEKEEAEAKEAEAKEADVDVDVEAAEADVDVEAKEAEAAEADVDVEAEAEVDSEEIVEEEQPRVEGLGTETAVPEILEADIAAGINEDSEQTPERDKKTLENEVANLLNNIKFEEE